MQPWAGATSAYLSAYVSASGVNGISETPTHNVSDNAVMAAQGVFVFAEDGVDFFPTVEDAAAYVEAVDVRDGVYEAFFTPDGERFLPHAVDETRVHLVPSGQVDIETLRALLEREQANRSIFNSDPRDPVSVANEFLARQWSARWPKWPSWLDRRLHGAEPPPIEAD